MFFKQNISGKNTYTHTHLINNRITLFYRVMSFTDDPLICTLRMRNNCIGNLVYGPTPINFSRTLYAHNLNNSKFNKSNLIYLM